jgi:aryl-alcohol dehydrogenase-like predicted oxidoreductase
MNEALLGRAIRGRREGLVIATKFGVRRTPENPGDFSVSGRPEYVRAACEGSLTRLGIDTIDLYYQHRVDPDTPIEDTMGALADLVRAGKVRYVGLSEASVQTIERAVAVHPVTALQSEYSLWTRDPEHNGVLAACEELGIGFVPFTPLGAGFLTGKIDTTTKFAPGDFRNISPRFEEDARAANMALVELLKRVAAEKEATPAQVALAWLLAQKPWIVPIPGTTKRHRLEENLGAVDVKLSGEELRKIEESASKIQVKGARLPEAVLKMTNG